MKQRVKEQLDILMERHPRLSVCRDSIEQAYGMLEEAYDSSHKLLLAGNGGSAADCEHIAGELMKSFKAVRALDKEFADKLIAVDDQIGSKLVKDLQKPLRAIPLTAHVSLSTAFINDKDPMGVYAQQLLGFGDPGDVFLAISTSGNAQNLINACVVAKAMGIRIIGLTGEKEGKLDRYADVCIKVPETDTYKVQELHLPVYHCLCLMLENNYFE